MEETRCSECGARLTSEPHDLRACVDELKRRLASREGPHE